MTNTESESKWTEATIEVSINEELDINEVCEQIENTLDHIQSKKSFDSKYKSPKSRQLSRFINPQLGNTTRLSHS